MKIVILLYISLLLLCGVNCTTSDFDVDFEFPLGGKWDYIVVGGGAAGCVVAARLSEDLQSTVLLIEAGGRSQRSVGGKDYVAAKYKKTPEGDTIFEEPLTRYDVPAFASTANPNNAANPTEGFLINTHKGPESPHGKILGGNAVHNNMVWTRATKGTINAWNVDGWSYDEVLPYFKKSENVKGSRLEGDNVYHGHTGPIQLSDPKGQDKAGGIFIQACIAAGYPNNTDFNGAQREGCGLHVFNIDADGIRESTAHAYLAPALKRRNLRLIVNALVTKVEFNSTTKQVTGVKFEKYGITWTVKAKKEVILSAGAINTPKLLMLSGVGPSAHLTSLGIPVISDLPVGKQMRGHAGATVRYQYPEQAYQSVYDLSNSAAEYAQFGTGAMASSGYFGFGFFKTNPSYPEANLLIGVTATNQMKQINVQISLHQPRGIENGVVNLTSADPHAPPYVYLNTWDSEDNVIDVAEGIKIARTIMTTAPATSIFGSEVVPGLTSYNTDTQLRNYVRNGNGSGKTHLWGGARLGNVGDNTAVLDPRARVKGVTGLRVCDLSIVPGIMGGHPMANVVMFGEIISDFILNDNAED